MAIRMTYSEWIAKLLEGGCTPDEIEAEIKAMHEIADLSEEETEALAQQDPS
jgi:hypothetical protein